jgi:hypothetical protein
VIHTCSDHCLCGLTLTRHERLLIEVHDDHHAPLGPSERRAGLGESGRGLFLVQQIADSWGSAHSTRAGGNVIWAELGTHA